MRVIIEDLISGFVVGLVTFFVIGWWSLLIGVLCGVLWVLGGVGWLQTKLWRRLGVPIVVCLSSALKGHLIGALITLPLMFGALCIGYGEESVGPPYDAGSWLGREFRRYTRLVWYIILAISMLPLAINR